MRQGEEEAEQVTQEFRQAKALSEREYEETAQSLAAKKELAPEEEAELATLWKKLVKLYHPDRFAWRASRCRCRGSGHRQRLARPPSSSCPIRLLGGALHCHAAADCE